MELVIQLLSRGGKVRHQQKVSGHKIQIGRALNNDVIVHDQHVCPHHAVISLTEQRELTITDLTSVNGLRTRKKRKIEGAKIFQSGDEFYLGKQRIRILSSEHPVEATVALTRAESLAEYFGTPIVAISAFMLFAFGFILSQYLTTVVEYEWKKNVNGLIGISFFLLLWPAFWSVLSRFFKQEARFLSHFTTLLCAAACLVTVELFGSFISYNLNSQVVYQVSDILLGSVVIYATLWFTLYLSTQQASPKRRRIAAIMTGLLVSLNYFNEFAQREDFSIYPKYSSQLYPPALHFSSGISIEDYVTNTDQVFLQASQSLQDKE